MRDLNPGDLIMKYKIYHNPKCSKSRQTLQLLKSSGVDYEILEYIKKSTHCR